MNPFRPQFSYAQEPSDDQAWASRGSYDQVQELHGPVRDGKVIFASKARAKGAGKGRWHETSVAACQAAELAAQLQGERDSYVTYNAFAIGRRKTDRLKALCALYVDIDHYKLADNPIGRLSPQALSELIGPYLASCDIPQPSIVLDTGRGIALTWLIDPIPAAALSRWSACQNVLRDRLMRFGCDPGAIDAARLTRLAGTVNGANGRTVSLLPTSTFERHDFEALAARLLPHSRTEIIAFKEARRARRKPRPAHSEKPTRPLLTGRTLHETRLEDLRKLVRGRYGDTAPPGRRNEVLLIAAASLSFLVPPPKLRSAIAATGAEFAGWSANESLSCAASVLSRVERLAHSGRDERYRYSTARIVSDLAITTDESRTFNLRTLRTPVVARERDKARKAVERRAAGRPTNGERRHEERRIRQRALDLYARGRTTRQIGEEMGRSREAVKKLLQRARAQGQEAQVSGSEQIKYDRALGRALGGDTGIPVNGGEPRPRQPRVDHKHPRSAAWRDAIPAPNHRPPICHPVSEIPRAMEE